MKVCVYACVGETVPRVFGTEMKSSLAAAFRNGGVPGVSAERVLNEMTPPFRFCLLVADELIAFCCLAAC